MQARYSEVLRRKTKACDGSVGYNLQGCTEEARISLRRCGIGRNHAMSHRAMTMPEVTVEPLCVVFSDLRRTGKGPARRIRHLGLSCCRQSGVACLMERDNKGGFTHWLWLLLPTSSRLPRFIPAGSRAVHPAVLVFPCDQEHFSFCCAFVN